MEEKERYERIGYCSYRDTETGVIGDNFVDLLNYQDRRIKELEEALKKANTNNYLTDYYLVEKENQQLKQGQKQLAIEELEKLKEVVESKTLLAECIDNQIKSLKGEEE